MHQKLRKKTIKLIIKRISNLVNLLIYSYVLIKIKNAYVQKIEIELMCTKNYYGI